MTSNQRRFKDIGTVLIIVEPGKSKFRVHKDLLVETSTFFRAAFSTDPVKEGAEQVMELEDEDEEIFDLFIAWVYSQQVFGLAFHGINEAESNLMLYLKLYMLADRRDVRRLQEQLIDELVNAIDIEDYAPSLDIISYVYDSLPDTGNPLRKLLAHWTAWRQRQAWFDDDNVILQLRHMPDFATDLVMAMRTLVHDLPTKDEGFPLDPEIFYC